MFGREELEQAIRRQKMAYDMLLWIVEQIDTGKVSFSVIHDKPSTADVMKEWMNTNYDYLPKYILPKREELEGFSNYFASYLSTSFELLKEPEFRARGSMECYCDLCLQMKSLSHLKRRKTDKFDREEAEQIRAIVVNGLAKEMSVELDFSTCMDIAKSKESLGDSAYLAYANCLLDRIESSIGGVYILVLWRQIAWNPEGSPINGFVLKTDDILMAQKRLKSRIQTIASL